MLVLVVAKHGDGVGSQAFDEVGGARVPAGGRSLDKHRPAGDVARRRERERLRRWRVGRCRWGRWRSGRCRRHQQQQLGCRRWPSRAAASSEPAGAASRRSGASVPRADSGRPPVLGLELADGSHRAAGAGPPSGRPARTRRTRAPPEKSRPTTRITCPDRTVPLETDNTGPATAEQPGQASRLPARPPAAIVEAPPCERTSGERRLTRPRARTLGRG